MEIMKCTIIRHDSSTYVFINMEALEAINELATHLNACYGRFIGDFEVITSPTIISREGTCDPGHDDSMENGITAKKRKK